MMMAEQQYALYIVYILILLIIIIILLLYVYIVYVYLYNNQINARALIGQSAMFYCAGKLMEKSRVFWII